MGTLMVYFFFFFLMIRRPPRPPLFPSTTLFRSVGIDDETRARAARRRYIAALPFPGSGNAEAAEEVVEGIVRRELQPAGPGLRLLDHLDVHHRDRKSTRLNSSHSQISYAVFCLK